MGEKTMYQSILKYKLTKQGTYITNLLNTWDQITNYEYGREFVDTGERKEDGTVIMQNIGDINHIDMTVANRGWIRITITSNPNINSDYHIHVKNTDELKDTVLAIVQKNLNIEKYNLNALYNSKPQSQNQGGQ